MHKEERTKREIEIWQKKMSGRLGGEEQICEQRSEGRTHMDLLWVVSEAGSHIKPECKHMVPKGTEKFQLIN